MDTQNIGQTCGDIVLRLDSLSPTMCEALAQRARTKRCTVHEMAESIIKSHLSCSVQNTEAAAD